jgi:hypothetical protein
MSIRTVTESTRAEVINPLITGLVEENASLKDRLIVLERAFIESQAAQKQALETVNAKYETIIADMQSKIKVLEGNLFATKKTAEEALRNGNIGWDRANEADRRAITALRRLGLSEDEIKRKGSAP